MMKQFVEDCGDGSNPVLNYANRFLGDKSLWQDQFRDGAPGPRQHPAMFRPPVHPAMIEKQMVDEFLNPQEFERFEMAGPPPVGPQDFLHMPPHAFPEQQFEPIEVPGVGNEWEQGAVDQRHQDWLRDFHNTTREPGPADLEEVWRSRNQNQRNWAEEFPHLPNFEEIYREKTEENKNWAESYSDEQRNEWKDLARRVSSIPDEKLQNSQFMQFVHKAAAGELSFDSEGRLVDENSSWANQFNREDQPWAEEFGDRSWASEFQPQNWAEEFDDEEGQLFNNYENVWNALRANDKIEDYAFTDKDNPYLNDAEAYQKGVDLFDRGDLKEAILALEAAVQQDPQNTQAWTKLGLAHAENDKDVLAIQALEQAIKVDPNNLEAMMAQAVSFTNESDQQKALHLIKQWLFRNPKYAHLFPTNEPHVQNYINIREIEEMLIIAVKSYDGIDPDVHSVLGLIYNLSYEHPKAIECFRAALRERPDDYQLWNKLGASTANSLDGKERAGEAIDAYFRALQKKPTYTRARANLGISYSAIHKYQDAASCFLGALEINNSPHLWDNLKKAFMDMNRPDLVAKIEHHNVDLFRSDLDF